MTPVTAVVTAYQRVEQTLATLASLEQCSPAPAEILVHVDGNEQRCADAIRQAHPAVRVLVSEGHVGPGGGRNRLLAEAANDLVASFDDDSYPIDRDYFARLAGVFDRFPDAAVVSAQITHHGQQTGADAKVAEWVSDFSGCGCAYRRQRFLSIGGYVPLVTAYGMEEVDFALQLHAQGGRVLHTPWLRVYHDTDLARHADAEVTSASIANLALLTYLRYPATMWGVGAIQCVNRVVWLLGHGRRRGVLQGIARVPALLRKHRAARRVVSAGALRSYLRLRRQPVAVGF
jgi:GT2 family glycosyltransferase